MDKTQVIDGPGVWMEGDALEQLRRLGEHPSVLRAVGMPDLHPGPGHPIGATVALDGRVWPALLGGDLGCGVTAVVVPKSRAKGDALERRVRDAFAAPVAAPSVWERVWTGGPAALPDPSTPDGLRALAARLGGAPTSAPTPDPDFAVQLGTIGGGNHFAEVSRVDRIVDRAAAAALGLDRRAIVVLVHSGSRAVGQHLARRWQNRVLEEADAHGFLAELQGAVNVARTNRLLLCWRLLTAIGAVRATSFRGVVDVTHNTAEAGEVDGHPAWLHRKGAAPAHDGQTTVVLGSRGAPSWFMTGSGSATCLCSVAHGAGRKLDRARATALMKHRHRRASLQRTATGGRVLCDDPQALYAEHPDCYKPIEPVITALEAAGAARRVASVLPLVTVK
jgi:release factor H-coupled RctB family protein